MEVHNAFSPWVPLSGLPAAPAAVPSPANHPLRRGRPFGGRSNGRARTSRLGRRRRSPASQEAPLAPAIAAAVSEARARARAASQCCGPGACRRAPPPRLKQVGRALGAAASHQRLHAACPALSVASKIPSALCHAAVEAS